MRIKMLMYKKKVVYFQEQSPKFMKMKLLIKKFLITFSGNCNLFVTLNELGQDSQREVRPLRL